MILRKQLTLDLGMMVQRSIGLLKVHCPPGGYKVADWALARGDKPTYRIVLAGYYEEHERLLAHGWAVHRWKAKGGYAHVSGTDDNPNCKREALFFSPHCRQHHELFDNRPGDPA